MNAVVRPCRVTTITPLLAAIVKQPEAYNMGHPAGGERLFE